MVGNCWLCCTSRVIFNMVVSNLVKNKVKNFCTRAWDEWTAEEKACHKIACHAHTNDEALMKNLNDASESAEALAKDAKMKCNLLCKRTETKRMLHAIAETVPVDMGGLCVVATNFMTTDFI